MNHKFRVGDLVQVTTTGYGCGVDDREKIVEIVEVGDYLRDPGYKVWPAIGNTRSCDGYIGETSFTLVTKSKPDKSKEVPSTMPSDVFMICDAYEAGVGDGMRPEITESRCAWKKGSNEEEAYHIGFELGRVRLERSRR